jgi:hypothetical protein
MDNLIEDTELEISQNDDIIEKPKRKMSDKTREALAAGRVKAAEKKALDKIPKSIPEPILKKKVVKEVELRPVETPAPKQRKKKQVIIYESESDDDEELPTIVIKRKSSKKADIPPPIPKVIEKVIEPEPEIEEKPLYRMRRI